VFGTDTTPVKLSPAERTRANRVYDNWGQSISFYEASPAISAFSRNLTPSCGHVYDDGKRDGRLQTVSRQGRLHYLPPRTAEGALRRPGPDRMESVPTTGTDTSAAADVTPCSPARLRQSRPALESTGCHLLSDQRRTPSGLLLIPTDSPSEIWD